MGDGTTDNTATFNAALVAAHNIGAIYFPPGRYSFSSKPDPIVYALRLFGAAQKESALIRSYTPADEGEGFLCPATSYVNLESLDIAAGDGTSGGCGIKLVLTSDPPAYGNWSWFEDMRITTDIPGANTGTWKYGVYLDGDDSSAAPQAPGLRDVQFDNCFVRVPCTEAAFYGKALRHFGWRGGYFDYNGKVIVTGGNYQSQNVTFSPVVGGVFHAEKVKGLLVNGPWTGGALKSSVDGYNVNVICDQLWDLESRKGWFASNKQISTPDGGMNMEVSCPGYVTREVTIPSGQSISESLNLNGANLVGIHMPSEWTEAPVTFLASDNGSRFSDLCNSGGAEIVISGSKSQYIPLSGLSAVRHLKVRSGTGYASIAQQFDRTIKLITASSPAV